MSRPNHANTARPRRLTQRLLTASVLGVLIATVTPLAYAGGAVRPHLVEVMPAAHISSDLRALGAVTSRTSLTVEITLTPRDPVGLARSLAAVTTPSSPSYRHYLARGAFARQFGASSATVRTVERALRQSGVASARLAANDLSIAATAHASVFEHLFHTTLARYQAPGDHVVYANDRPARLVPSLAGAVTGVIGLDDLAQASTSLVHLARPGLPHVVLPNLTGPTPAASCASAISSAGFSAADIAGAYGLSSLYGAGDEGQGVTIGIVEFSGFVSQDLSAYESCYSPAPAPTISTVTVGTGTLSTDPESMLEAELDIEDVIGLAPAASIIVYESTGSSANDAYAAYAQAVDADEAQVITTSWGACEAATPTSVARAENTLFEQAALQGETVVAAAGDSGSEDCDAALRGPQQYGLAVDDPASQPYVTGVGGTSLTLSPSRTEAVWNEPGAEGGSGGGGISSLWPMPAYQTDAASTLAVSSAAEGTNPCGVASGGCREVPDATANAGTPYAIYCSITPECSASGGWLSLGGTSAAAPTWAAVAALADASPECVASGPLGFLNPELYAVASGSDYASAFTDITSGNNDYTSTSDGKWPAGVGYDLASGLGSPIVGSGSDNGLVAQLCSPATLAAALATHSLPVPTVSKVTPARTSSTGGGRIIVTGANFVGVRSVALGTRPATAFTVLSPTEIRVTVPPGKGTVHVLVTTRAGHNSRLETSDVEYVALPSISRLVPGTGPSAGGGVVVVIGRNLTKIRLVRFGAAPATRVVARSATRLIITAPAGHGIVAVRITTSQGTSAAVTADRYRYR